MATKDTSHQLTSLVRENFNRVSSEIRIMQSVYFPRQKHSFPDLDVLKRDFSFFTAIKKWEYKVHFQVKPEQVHIAVWEKLRHSNGSSATADHSNDSGVSMTSSPLPSLLINARESNGVVFHTPQT